jgi:hypothetical protein
LAGRPQRTAKLGDFEADRGHDIMKDLWETGYDDVN